MAYRTPPPLWKQRSWSPDVIRDEAWERRKGLAARRTRSLTDDDIEELKACIELGFGFESSPEVDRKLTDTIPALELYYAVVNKQYGGPSISRTSSMCSSTNSMSVDEESDPSADVTSPIIDPCEDPEVVKARLRQWAQLVGCAVREAASSPKLTQFSLE